VLQQFWIFFKNLLHGDFGSTLLTGRPVMEDLARLLPATAELATVMIILGAGIGIPLGVYAAVNRGRASPVMRCVSSHCLALNTYLLDRHVGLMLFNAKLGWVGGSGRLRACLNQPYYPQFHVETIEPGICDHCTSQGPAERPRCRGANDRIRRLRDCHCRGPLERANGTFSLCA
jgi:ABC-type dipeptide/oligopeptide/nickel transport system permease component